MIDPSVEQPRHRRGWNALPGPVAVGAAGESARRLGRKSFRERILWLALLPVYVVMAVLVTIGYAIAVLVVDVRSWFRRGQDRD